MIQKYIRDIITLVGVIWKTCKTLNLADKNFSKQVKEMGITKFIKQNKITPICNACGMLNGHDENCWKPTDNEIRVAERFFPTIK